MASAFALALARESSQASNGRRLSYGGSTATHLQGNACGQSPDGAGTLRARRARIHPSLNAATNWSCGTGTGARSPPGFQPHSTSLSSPTCLSSASKSRSPLLLLVLDHRAQLRGGQADPGHLLVRRRQRPVRCAGRRVRAVAGGRIGFGMAGGAGQARRALAFGAAHHAIVCGVPASNCNGASPGIWQLLAARMLEHLLTVAKASTALRLLLRADARAAGGEQGEAGKRRTRCVSASAWSSPHAFAAWPASRQAGSGSSRRRWPVSANTRVGHGRRDRRRAGFADAARSFPCSARYALRPPASRSCRSTW